MGLSLLDHIDMERLIERALRHVNMKHMVKLAIKDIDLKDITTEILSDLKIEGLDMYFIVEKWPDSDDYEVLGMAYDRKAAEEIKAEKPDKFNTLKIVRLKMGHLIKIMEDMGGTEEIS